MSHADLPPELRQLESALTSSQPEPSPALRQRVLAAVGRELRSSPAAGVWWLAAGVAAAVLLAINFSISAINDMDFGLGGGIGDDVGTTASQIHALLPDWPQRETRRQALLLAAGTCLVPGPLAPAGELGSSRHLEHDLKP
jgi:hypothetical protein